MTATETQNAAVVQGNRERPAPHHPHRGAVHREARFGRLLLLPALILTLAVTQIPFLVTIVFSFSNWNMLDPSKRGFAGLGNYANLFTAGEFFPSLWTTVALVVVCVFLALIGGLTLALLLNRRFRGRPLARTLAITPFLIMPAAASLSWKWSLFDANSGLLNWLIGLFGFPPIAWITDLPMVSVATVVIWQYTPFMMLILLAGLQSQPVETLEAAQVDGAGPGQLFRYLTVPHLERYLQLAIALGTILILQTFDPIAIMTDGYGGKTLPYLLYERAFIGLNVGQAAAYGVVAVLISIPVALVALRGIFAAIQSEGR